MLARLPAGWRPRLGRKAGLATTALLLVAGGAAVISTAAGAAPSDKNKGQAHQVLTDPQPASNGDFTGHGANDHGPYDSTRDGSPSANGNGDGNAIGKPCAGCVGKADNKNPQGQMPGGEDANAGYECDRNNGIGKTNPAHTGCLAGTTTGETTTTGTTTGETTTTGTTTGETTTTGGTTTGETATTGGTTTGETTTGETATTGGTTTGQVAGEVGQTMPGQVVEAASTEQPLASTGVPVLQLVAMALVALAGGIGLAFLGRARRRRAGSTA
jgi:hypothetical protein